MEKWAGWGWGGGGWGFSLQLQSEGLLGTLWVPKDPKFPGSMLPDPAGPLYRWLMDLAPEV